MFKKERNTNSPVHMQFWVGKTATKDFFGQNLSSGDVFKQEKSPTKTAHGKDHF